MPLPIREIIGGILLKTVSIVAGPPIFWMATEMKISATAQVISSALLVLANRKEVSHLTRSAVHEPLVCTKIFCQDCADLSVRAIHGADKLIARASLCSSF